MTEWEEKHVIGQTLTDVSREYPEFFMITGITRSFSGEINEIQALNVYGRKEHISRERIKGFTSGDSWEYELPSAELVERLMERKDHD